jgi:hypothetical protein
MAPAPVAVVSDNGRCFRGEVFKTAFDGQTRRYDTSGLGCDHPRPMASSKGGSAP